MLSPHTFTKVILFPFLVTRAILLIVGLLSPGILAFSYNADIAIEERGWFFTETRALDMWMRWDSGWYYGIVDGGYRMVENTYTMSNLAFYPVYPVLVKSILFLVPASLESPEMIITIGVVIANLMLLGSLILLYKLSMYIFNNENTAKKAVWLLLLFPTSFFLSSFYTESTFLFFCLLSFWWAVQNKWKHVALAAAILTATRVVGIMVLLPLFYIYLQQRDFSLKKLDRSLLWFVLMPLGLLLFFSYLYLLTGDFLAAMHVQAAWGKQLSNPLTSLVNPTGYWPFITQLDQIGIIGTFVASAVLLKKNYGSFGVPFALYSVLLIIPTLFTGTIDSALRFIVVIFPLYWVIADYCMKHKATQLMTGGVFLFLQMVLFIRFTQFYWAG